MGILRILLVLGLIAGCAYLALRAPWTARLAPSGTTVKLGDAAIWAAPETPPLDAFPGFGESSEAPRVDDGIRITVDTGVQAVVELDRRAYFGKACVVIVGLFFLFGIIGTIIQRRPETTDVAFSLWLSLGMLAGILTSATVGHFRGQETLPLVSLFMLVGFLMGFIICIRSQMSPPLAAEPKRKSKKSKA
ncbi:MAG: F0F1-type ATP synthase assembly protein I [Verrucomicrobiales bacterium]|jgi:F0F1-type ATP synthase assembly protein I